MWAGSLESIAREIEVGIEQLGDEWDDAFSRHVAERIALVESLLRDIRLGAVSAGAGRHR